MYILLSFPQWFAPLYAMMWFPLAEHSSSSKAPFYQSRFPQPVHPASGNWNRPINCDSTYSAQ